MLVPLDSATAAAAGGMIVPYYVGVFSPAGTAGEVCRQATRLVPAAAVEQPQAAVVTTKGAVSPGAAAVSGSNGLHLLNEFVTYVNSGVTVPAPVSPSAS